MYGEAVEAALADHTAVRDCAVVRREPEHGRPTLVAYLVPAGPFRREEIDELVRSVGATAEEPLTWVPVTSLPLTKDGNVDREVLARVPSVDEALAEAWQQRLRGLAGIADAAAVVEEDPRPDPVLHMASILPGWSRREEGLTDAVETADRSGARPGSVATRSESDGGPLEIPPQAPATLPEALRRAATSDRDRGLLHLTSDGTVAETYSELRQRAAGMGAELRAAGCTPGSPVLLQLGDTAEFIGAFWGCVAAGAVPVPVGMPTDYREGTGNVEKLMRAWELLERPVVVTSRPGAERLAELAERRGFEGFSAVAVEDLGRSGEEELDDWHDAVPEDVALMMLTSGTTGAPKAVMLTHRNVLGRSAAESRLIDLSADDVTLNFMPMDHVAGLVYFHVRDVFLACRQIHAATDLVLQQPTRWLDLLDRHRVTVTFAPNFVYALVNERADEVVGGSWDLSSVRYFHNGGEAIVASTARRFLALLEPHGLPPTAMLPAWGMSETSSAVTLDTGFRRSSTSDDDPFVQVGEPIPGFRMRIVDGDGRVVPEETEGQLEVRGVSVTPGYYRNPEASAESFTADGWFRTGDLGFLREGRLTITGRMKNVIIVHGVNYYSHEIEKVVDDVEGVAPTWTAACSVRSPGLETDQLAIFFHPEVSDDWTLTRVLKEIRQEVGRRIGLRPRYLVPVEKDEVPRTGIGKIQRPILKGRFEDGGFEPSLRRVDRLEGNAQTLPSWFFRPTWVRRKARPRPGTSGGCLLLLDGTGLGDEVRSTLRDRDGELVTVRAADGFERRGARDFRVDPAVPDHLRRVLEAVAAEDVEIRSVVNLWPYTAPEVDGPGAGELQRAHALGPHGVAGLARTLDGIRQGNGTVRLLVATRRAFRVEDVGGEGFATASVAPLARTLSQEVPWLDCTTVDLEGDDPRVDAGHVLAELASASVDGEAAYRDGSRWVRRLVRLGEEEFSGAPPAFRRGGVYLVTGGLGGIGREVVRHLLEDYEARVLAVGRRELSGGSGSEGDDPRTRERREALRELGRLPGQIEYRSVDVCDVDALNRAVGSLEERWSEELSGIVHLAGDFREREVLAGAPDEYPAVARAKVMGTWNLCRLVRERPGATLVAFSSVNAFFGGYGAGAYGAANAFLEAAVDRLRQQDACDARCFAWSLWDEVGMSRGLGLAAAAARRGYRAISPRKGRDSFLAALASGESHLLVGLDGSNLNIRPWVLSGDLVARRLAAYVAPRSAATVDAGEPPRDGFGAPVPCELRGVEAIPRTSDGGVRWRALEDGDLAVRPDPAPPSTELERMIASEWKELLGLDAISVEENFFDLGADSVLLARARARIQSQVGAEVKLTTLYEYPTVRELAGFVSGTTGESPETPRLADSRKRGTDRRRLLASLRRGPQDGESSSTAGDD